MRTPSLGYVTESISTEYFRRSRLSNYAILNFLSGVVVLRLDWWAHIIYLGEFTFWADPISW